MGFHRSPVLSSPTPWTFNCPWCFSRRTLLALLYVHIYSHQPAVTAEQPLHWWCPSLQLNKLSEMVLALTGLSLIFLHNNWTSLYKVLYDLITVTAHFSWHLVGLLHVKPFLCQAVAVVVSLQVTMVTWGRAVISSNTPLLRHGLLSNWAWAPACPTTVTWVNRWLKQSPFMGEKQQKWSPSDLSFKFWSLCKLLWEKWR